MKVIKGGITAPSGFKASAIHCGLKKRGLDLALIYSEVLGKAFGLFTTNEIQAAPIKLSKAHLKNNQAQAILINSAYANSCTGKRGLEDADKIGGVAASGLGIDKGELLLASTGMIGKPLPVIKIVKAIPKLVGALSRGSGRAFTKAIMTTDRAPKDIAVKFKVGRNPVTIGAACKGAGMISPNLATMLAFFTTDADITLPALVKALVSSVDKSFNQITIDGDMSTNDCVIILANGLARNPTIALGSSGFKAFQEALDYAAGTLAKLMVKGGEGVRKFIEVTVKGTRTLTDAKLAARKIANSPLVKTMVGGADPNWGRVIAALGASGIKFKESKVNLWLGNNLVLKSGRLVPKALGKLRSILSKDEVKITLDLKAGKSKASVWTGDLTEEYVKINTNYTT